MLQGSIKVFPTKVGGNLFLVSRTYPNKDRMGGCCESGKTKPCGTDCIWYARYTFMIF